MFPNPQDALPLPRLDGPAKLIRCAEELATACRNGGDATEALAREWVTALASEQPDAFGLGAWDAERRAAAIGRYATERMQGAACGLEEARLVVARCHGFADWDRLAHHVEELGDPDSPVARFERAADAIIDGDIGTLRHLLATDPALVQARSTREHRATLLHHVAANGVEDFRQRTPANIGAIARLLLDRGAEVDAEADVYGGGATTLGLVVTSAHPRKTGVQLELADLLLERGARLDDGMPLGALHNGCPEAAAHLVERGGTADLEVAAGIGRADLVAVRLADASPEERVAALLMASWYGRREVVALVLDHGVDPGARDPDDGKTALHLAAYQGDLPLVRLLLALGAPIEVLDDCYHTQPLVWALHAWLVEGRGDAVAYRDVLLALASAGAGVRPEWIDDKRIRDDAELDAALRKGVR